jgi:flavodoxin
MDALVVYESMFGNTEEIAKAIAEGLSTRLRTEVAEAGRAPGAVGRRSGCWWSAGRRTPSP